LALKKKLEGIIVPMPTAFGPDGRFDAKRMRAFVDFLIDGGIDGLFPLGTSGEFALLDREERKLVVDTVVDQTKGRVPVLAGVSDPSLSNVVQFVRDARDAGADAVVATPPYYFATGEDGLYQHFETISSKGDLPLFVYNIPEWTHLFVPPSVIQRLADQRLIAGMKYTEYNLLNLLKFIRVAGNKVSIFTGSDAMTFTNLEFGGSGGVIGVANVAPRQAASIFDLFKKGDLEGAKNTQVKLLPAIEAIGVGRFPAGLKAAMKLIGVPVGNVHPPLEPLTSREVENVAGLLREAGLLKRTAVAARGGA
jgi:4-hydroxy-tetrahydrodipicolinate synthase